MVAQLEHPDRVDQQSVRAVRWWVPVAIFIVSTALHSFGLMGLQVLTQVDFTLVAVFQLGPSLGLLTTWLILRDRLLPYLPGPEEARPLFLRRMLAAVGVMVALGLLTFGVALVVGAAGGERPFVGGVFVSFVVFQLIGALAEEFGWRGFLQPAFEARWGAVAAALVTGVIWSLWHVNRLVNPLLLAGFTVFSVAFSLVLGVLARGAWWQRGLVAGCAHWGANLAFYFFTDSSMVLGGEIAGMLPIMLPSVILAVAALVWIAGKPRQRDSVR